jgi:hypothetical protein
MSDGIKFNEAAFKHKVARFDIEWAVFHAMKCRKDYLLSDLRDAD